ncbi:hypothetical protein TNCV_1851421 [Trichonephila clavipes]|nr:hypothetical protein TNCV_1851421 [Trichonephila clavipes]
MRCSINYKGTGTLQMFGFPKEDFLPKKWMQAISRKDFAPSKYSKNLEYSLESYQCLGLHRNVGASRFNEPSGQQGCVLARTVESNQGGRFDGNETVADSFRSGAVSFKSTYIPFLEAFFLLTSARKNTPSDSELATRSHSSVRSSPLR